MKDSGLGCYIDGFYYGMFGYADDCALLSPSRDSLQQMLNICEKYFTAHGIKISVNAIVKKSKTKCLAFNVGFEPSPIYLYNRQLPWVESAKHLGHFISNNESTSDAILQSRGKFISDVHSIRQELGDQNPQVFISLVQTYLCSMYGSNLWDLFSVSADKLFISWNFMLRDTFNLPFATHRYILYNISKIQHLRVSLIKRFIKFHDKLSNCLKPEIQHLFNIQKWDCRSVFGRNYFNICNEFNVPAINYIDIRDIVMPIKIPDNEKWRLPLLYDLLYLRDGCLDSTDIPRTDIDFMLNFICCD